jgi:hypothetical protein
MHPFQIPCPPLALGPGIVKVFRVLNSSRPGKPSKMMRSDI